MCNFGLQFKIDGAWHTWIHYDKFHELVSVGIYSYRCIACASTYTTPLLLIVFSLDSSHSPSLQMRQYESSEGRQTFTSLDYVARTPEWALIGHSQRGFDPGETRWHRKSKKDISGC